MATTSALSSPSSGKSFGSIGTRIETIKDEAITLMGAWESDLGVDDLASRAANLRGLTDALAAVLYEIDNALVAL
jgi:hypothetical protein